MEPKYGGISKQEMPEKADITLSDNFICHLIIEVTDMLKINDTVH